MARLLLGPRGNPTQSGQHTFEVRAADWSGNFSAVLTWKWTVDKVAPDTSLLSGPAGTVASRSVGFNFVANEAGSFRCTLNAVATLCSSPQSYPNLADGTYTFSVAARDVAGNLDLSPATRTFTVDTVAPETGLTGGPTEGTKVATASASFGLTSTEGTSTFACTLDGAPLSCNATTGLTELGQGSHTFTAAAVDAVGNTDATPATRTWTVDTVSPTASSARPTGSRVSLDSNASVVFSEAMKKATVEAVTNGVPKNFYLTLSGTKVRAVVTYTQSRERCVQGGAQPRPEPRAPAARTSSA